MRERCGPRRRPGGYGLTRPCKTGTFSLLLLILAVLASGALMELAGATPRIAVVNAGSCGISGYIRTRWPVQKAELLVWNRAGRSPEDPAAGGILLKPQVRSFGRAGGEYLYGWTARVRFSRADACRLEMVIYRLPLLVYRQRVELRVAADGGADAGRVRQHVAYLASGNLRGRAPGTPGGELAARYIADSFRKAGLKPGVDGSWYQSVRCYEFGLIDLNRRLMPVLKPSCPVNSPNVIGVIPGRRPGAIVVGAHYDHLGTWGGETLWGANDNASGVAVLLETARVMAMRKNSGYTLVFAAWTGEEQGFRGSRRFLLDSPYQIRAVINLDCLGNGGGRLVVSGRSGELGLALDQAAACTGVRLLEEGLRGSMPGDGDVFAEEGFTAVNLFSPNWLINNHTVRDDTGNVNQADLEQATDFVITALKLFNSF